MSQPQLIVTLSPGGSLIAELPGANGSRRQINLSATDAEQAIETLKRILQGQLKSQIELGLDGAPTEAQARHWQRHSGLWGDPSCRFCQAEGRFQTPRKRKSRPVEVARHGAGPEGEVRVRKGAGVKPSGKILVDDPDGGVLPLLLTRREARERGLRERAREQKLRLTPEEIGL